MQYRSSITFAVLAAVSAAQAAETCPDGNGSNNLNGVDYCCPGIALGGSGTSISCDIGYTTVPLTQFDYTQIVYGDATTTSAGNGGGHHSPTPIISHTFFPTTMSSSPSPRPTSQSPGTTINIGSPDAPDQTSGPGGSQNSGGDGEDGDSSSSSTTTTTTTTTTNEGGDDQPGAAARVGAAPVLGLAAVLMGMVML